MTLSRKICPCTSPLQPKKYISLTLQIFFSMSLLGLLVFIIKLTNFHPETKYKSVYFSISMLANIILNLVIFVSIISLEQKNWERIIKFAYFIITVKCFRLITYTLQTVVQMIKAVLIIKKSGSKEIILKQISNIFVEVFSLVIGLSLFIWMIFMGLGILKMAKFMIQTGDQEFDIVSKNLEINDEINSLKTNIINISKDNNYTSL